MIGTIGPFVKEAKKPTDWLSTLVSYTAGSLVSSMGLGAVLGFLGLALIPDQWRPLALLVLAVVGIALALTDLGIGGMQTLTLRRQTCPVWWHTLGPVRTAFAWGIDLGLGFTTIRVASLYWVIALVVVALASPLVGAAILGSYGFALAFNLVIGVQFLEMSKGGIFGIHALRLFQPLKVSLAVVLFAWCIFLLIAVFMGF